MSQVIPKVAWLHVEARRLLCVRSAGRDLFYIPGGKPNPGEDDATALAREIEEELGLILQNATIAPAGRFVAPADGKPGLDVVVDAFTAACRGIPVPQGEIAELRYLASADASAVSAVTRAILQTLKDDDVID